jgi:sulfopyruvate decarboxylase subunit alpha
MATATEAPARERAGALNGSTVISAIKAAGVSHVLAVPDLHTCDGLLTPIATDPDLTLIRTCKEDECLGIAAGLSYGDKRAVILIQYTGMLYAMNAIRAVAVSYKQPIVLMVGLLGKEEGLAPPKSKRLGVRVIEPMLDLMGVPHHLIETDADAPMIAPAIDQTYEQSFPVGLLIGRSPTRS